MTTVDHTDWVSLLGRILQGTPKLPGAACVGHAELFRARDNDEHPDTAHERHTAAAAICRRCPALAGCGAWVAGLRPAQRPSGVIAGRIPLATTVGRPPAGATR